MKFVKFILFLSVLLLTSCRLNKKITKDVKHLDIPVDSVVVIQPDNDGDGVADIIDEDITGSPHIQVGSGSPKPKITISYTTLTGGSGVVNSQVVMSSPINQGLIAYSVPKNMVVGNRYSIKIRISKEKNENQLIIGDRRIPIGDTNVSVVSIEPIRVEPIMSAELISEKGAFDIDTLSTSVQNIEEHGYTEWEWGITPIKGGENPLRLVVKVRLKTDQGFIYKDIVVFDKVVKIKSNVSFSVKRWVSKYWQWLISTVIIPFIVWFYKRRKEEKDEKKKKGRK